MVFQGLERFKSDTNLLTGVARIHEVRLEEYCSLLQTLRSLLLHYSPWDLSLEMCVYSSGSERLGQGRHPLQRGAQR